MPNTLRKTKFCPYCGATLTHERNNLLTCNNSHHIYINPRATTSAVIENENGQILLVKRKVEPSINMWDTPGGFIDLNENAEASVIREVKEELGITLSNVSYIGSVYDIYYYQEVDYPTLGLLFRSKVSSHELISVGSDVSAYQFFDKKNFPFDQLAFVSLKTFFKEYLI